MNERGFTLIEVLVALAVFSIAIIGLTRAGSQSAQATSAIESRMIAGIVADNQLILSRQLPARVGTRTGTSEQLSRQFEFEVLTETTELAGLLKMTVRVQEKNRDQVLVERTSFVSAGS